MHSITTIEIDKKTRIKVFEETEPDWSWAEDIATKADIRSGKIQQFTVSVVTYDKTGELSGSDMIGGVVVDLHKDVEVQIKDLVKVYEMVKNAKYELNKKINGVLNAYKKRLK